VKTAFLYSKRNGAAQRIFQTREGSDHSAFRPGRLVGRRMHCISSTTSGGDYEVFSPSCYPGKVSYSCSQETGYRAVWESRLSFH
jgi:hypothetical protein